MNLHNTDPNELLKKEAEAFDRQVDERIKNGFIPDLRRLKKVDWFYNNVWRDPEFVKIHLLPKVDFVLNIARERGGKVVELGCGYGYLSLELARNGLDVLGVDLSPQSIKIAQEFTNHHLKLKLHYQCADILSFDLGTETYDSIIFFGSLHHLADIDRVLQKVHRALKKKGSLIVCEPIEDNFTKDQAEFAAILRAVLPTWISFEEKFNKIGDPASWDAYVNDIYNEYTFQGEHEQSPMDNINSSEEGMLDGIKKYFQVQRVEYSDAFIDKLIGGLRGDDKYALARFLKFLDSHLIRKKVLRPTFIQIHAVKK